MNLTNRETLILNNVCDHIENKMIGTQFDKVINNVINGIVFVTTNSNHVGAFSAWKDKNPIVIFNSKIFSSTDDEIKVSVLHELMHFMIDTENLKPDSLEEARHDLSCYGLLGVPIPITHWAHC